MQSATVTVGSLLSFISPNYLDNLVVQPNERLKSDYITYDSQRWRENKRTFINPLKEQKEITRHHRSS
jgi:carboxymethylenebutenolidase